MVANLILIQLLLTGYTLLLHILSCLEYPRNLLYVLYPLPECLKFWKTSQIVYMQGTAWKFKVSAIANTTPLSLVTGSE